MRVLNVSDVIEKERLNQPYKLLTVGNLGRGNHLNLGEIKVGDKLAAEIIAESAGEKHKLSAESVKKYEQELCAIKLLEKHTCLMGYTNFNCEFKFSLVTRDCNEMPHNCSQLYDDLEKQLENHAVKVIQISKDEMIEQVISVDLRRVVIVPLNYVFEFKQNLLRIVNDKGVYIKYEGNEIDVTTTTEVLESCGWLENLCELNLSPIISLPVRGENCEFFKKKFNIFFIEEVSLSHFVIGYDEIWG